MQSRILVIDDSKTVRLMVRTALRSFACDVMEAGNGADGLAAATRGRPDLILLDVMMPVMGGIETLAWLRTNRDTAGVPVIMLAPAGPVGASAAAKGCDLLLKPFRRDEVVERIGRIVPLRPATAGHQAAMPTVG